MKKIRNQLKAISKNLAALSKQVDKVSKQVEKATSPKATSPKRVSKKAGSKKVSPKKTAKKMPRMKKTSVKRTGTAGKLSLTDRVYNVIKRSRKGVTIASLKKKTGLQDKQLSNVLYKLTKKGSVTAQARGLYVPK